LNSIADKSFGLHDDFYTIYDNSLPEEYIRKLQ